MSTAGARRGAKKAATTGTIDPKAPQIKSLNAASQASSRRSEPLSVQQARSAGRNAPHQEKGSHTLPIRNSKPTTGQRQDIKGPETSQRRRTAPKPGPRGQQLSRGGAQPAAGVGDKRPRSEKSAAAGSSTSDDSQPRPNKQISQSAADSRNMQLKQERADRAAQVLASADKAILDGMKVQFLEQFSMYFPVVGQVHEEYPDHCIPANLSSIYNSRHSAPLPRMEPTGRLTEENYRTTMAPSSTWQLSTVHNCCASTLCSLCP